MSGLLDDLEPASVAAANPPTLPPAPKPPKSLLDDLEPVSLAPRAATGALESIQAGFQGSAPGLAWRGKLPDLVIDPQHAAWWERALSGMTHVGAELPLMIGGAIAGAPAGAALGTAVAPGVGTAVGSLLGAGAGMGAIPAAIRQTLIEAYKSGDVMTAADFWNSVREVAKTTATEAGINAAAMGAGAVAGRVVGKAIAPSIGQSISVPTAIRSIEAADIATQIAAMPTIPAILQGRLPDAQEFVDAAILIGGLKAAHVASSNIVSVFVKTGKTPAEQVADVQEGRVDPQEFVGPPEKPVDPEVLKALLKARLDAINIKLEGTPDKTVTGPDGKPITIPGQPKQFVSPEERAERDWLAANIDNADALAKRYSLKRPQQTEDEYVPPSRAEMLKVQENLFTETARLDEMAAKAEATPLSDPERLEMNALKARVLDLENQLRAGAPELSRIPTYTADQFVEARKQADTRLAELTTKAETEALTDTERAERVFLSNSLDRPTALAKHFGFEPILTERPTPQAIDASAQRIHDDVLQQLKDADEARKVAGLEPLGDDHAQAVAALVRARVRTRAERLGVLPESLYAERPVKIEDVNKLQGEPEPAPAAEPGTITPEAPAAAGPELDLFGEPIQPPPLESQNQVATVEPAMVPVAGLTLSKDVPQFKAGANAKGVVEPLGGAWDPTGVGPIQIWQRLNGAMEVISGRHRLDKAQREGVDQIWAQVHKESEGFTRDMAAALDAMLNIRDGQGSVADYAQFFKAAGLTKDAAERAGLLARGKGKSGFSIARDASPDLLASHRAGNLSDEAALVISSTAPGSERLQALGIAAVQDGKTLLYASNLMRSVDMMAAERMMAGEQGDIFGFDDSALKEASAMAKRASSKQRAISEQIAAVSGASKRPELARKMGVNVEDPAAVQAKIIELKNEQYLWDNWPLYPELVAKLRGETLGQDAFEPPSIKINVDDLSKGVLARMSINLQSKGYDIRGSDDVRMLLKTRRAINGVLSHPDWIEAYNTAVEGAKATRERVDAKAAERNASKNVDFARMRELGLTEDWREAGYITPSGSLVDLSGKREGGQPGTRSYDHREAGGTAGMQEYMAIGNIRIDANSGMIDISREPTAQQYRRLLELIEDKNGEVVIDLENGLGEQRSDGTYARAKQYQSTQHDAGTSPKRIIGTIKSFFNNQTLKQGPVDEFPLKPETPAEAAARDQVAEQAAQRKENGETPNTLYQDIRDRWYRSALGEAIQNANMKAAPAKGWQDFLKGQVAKGGVKADEIKWSGVEDWLKLQEGKVTKEQVADYLASNGVKVEEVMLGDQQRGGFDVIQRAMREEGYDIERDGIAEDAGITYLDQEGDPIDFQDLPPNLQEVVNRNADAAGNEPTGTTKFGTYQLPGGENYRELALTLPKGSIGPTDYRVPPAHEMGGTADDNRLAHIRFNERTDAEGKKVLFIEEIQSDWAQKGKKEGFIKKWTPEETAKFTVEDTLPDPVPPQELKTHAMWSESDFLYFRDKGYDDKEILAFWDRDLPRGDGPAEHPGYLRQRKANRDYIVKDADGNEVKTVPGSMNDSPNEALALVRRAAENGTLKMGGIPAAPFVGKTDAWVSLAMKRVIRYAAENGFDKVAWTRGEQQVERYSSALRKAVDVIEWKKTPEGVQLVGYKNQKGQAIASPELRGPALDAVERNDNLGFDSRSMGLHALWEARSNWRQIYDIPDAADQQVIQKYLDDAEAAMHRQRRDKVVDTTEKEDALSDSIGKAMADQIRNDPNQTGTIEGNQITVSDTGMAGFYDKIVPKVAKEVLKKLGGGKVEEVNIGDAQKHDLYVVKTNPTTWQIKDEMTGQWLGHSSEQWVDSPVEAKEFRSESEATQASSKIQDMPANRPQPGFQITPAMREGAMAGQPLFQKQTDQLHRGSYDIAENLITTLQGADKSTVVHELTHSWLEEMKADAARPDAPASIKADWEIIRRELAIPENGEISRASHEQFARTGERYLAEGEAPSRELQSVFARFREWLLDIYKSVMNLNVEINPELRQVLDRMLATDEEIAAARDLGVPRAYVPEAAAATKDAIVPPPEARPARRKINPGFEAEQASMQPYADELPPGPGDAPDNIHVNYAYINTPTDVKLAMQRMAEIDQANIQRQRGGTEGVKSWAEANAEQAKYLNDILGGGPDTLHLFEPRDPDAPHVDVRLGILKKLAVGAAKDSARLRDVVLQAGHDATVRQQLEYMGSIERARMIQAEFLGERASVARALNALKDVTEGTGEIGRMLEAIGLGDEGKLFQAGRTPAEEQAYLKAKLDEILQNYKGKTVLDIAKLHKEIGTLKGTFKLAKEVSQATRWEQIVEGWRAGLLSGPVTHTTNLLGTEAFHVMRPAVDALASIIGMARGASPGMGESDRASMSEAVARLTGMLGGVQDGIKVAIAEFKADEATGKTEAYRTAIPGQAGRIIRTPLRLMGAEDALVTTMYTRGEIRTLAIRQAFDEDLNPSTREFAERVAYLQDNPTPEMQVAAETAATRMTFNAPLGEKGVFLQGFVNKWNLQWMIPFIRTPINIAKELLRMSPFAPAIGEWRQAFAKGGVERDRALAEMALGSGIMAITMAYAFAGNVSGAGSPDPGKNRGKAGVWQPYSILIGDTWYEYARIQPTGTLMGMAADMAAIWDHMTDEEKDKVPRMLSAAFAQAITNQTFLQGITNFVNAMSDPARFGPRFLQQMAGSAVPNIIGQPTTMADPVVREVNSALEAIQARIPGMRQDLLPKRDWLGEPVQTKERLGVVMPVREQQISDDKVRQEAARLDISMAAAPKKTHIGKGTGKLGDVELTPQERDAFEKIGGEFAHGILQNIVNAPGYDQMPDLVKRKIFSNVLTAAHRVAAVQAMPMEKRIAYLQEITEKVQQELTPGDAP